MNNISKDLDIDKNLRGLIIPNHPDICRIKLKKDVDSLVETVKLNYSSICHRYYSYKANYFGKKKLDFWDRNAPYPGTKIKNISWDTAKSLVYDSYDNFDKRTSDVVKMFYDKSWIHALPLRGKTSGPFPIQLFHLVILTFY